MRRAAKRRCLSTSKSTARFGKISGMGSWPSRAAKRRAFLTSNTGQRVWNFAWLRIKSIRPAGRSIIVLPGWMHTMDALIERLNVKLREWKPETAAQVRECVAEIIALADQQVLDLLRSRAVEQQVMDMLDEPASR